MQNNFPKDKNNNPSKNDSRDEILYKFEQSIKIFSLMKNPNYFFQEYRKFIQIQNKYNNKNSKNRYYLISLKWLIKFTNFCNSKGCFYEFECPPAIDNNEIFIQDSALKAQNDLSIFSNNKVFSENNISIVIKDVWTKLKNLFGGGPEYEIIYNYNKKENNLIEEGVRINLLFIRKNIKDIKQDDNIDDYIHNEHIYLSQNCNVEYLKQYINDILHQYKDKFFSKNNNQILLENIIENINYRLWLYSSFYGTPKKIAEFIREQLIYNLNLDENKLIDWRKFNKINGYNFEIIPLSFFEKNIIQDIFPNKTTKFFDYKNEFENLKKMEEEHSLPYFTIIIEEAPFTLMKEDIIYRLGACEKCKYSQITYNACECKNCFFCLKSCEAIYRERKNIHFMKCKIHIMSIFNNENKVFYHNNETNILQFSLIGLANLGNTCYMNSALQCLRAIKELTKYFLNYFDENQLNKKNIMGTEGFLALAYANYIYKMNLGNKDFLNLKNFKCAIGIVDDRFSGTDQQDTHEFLSFLIDSIHEDLNKVIIKPTVKRKNSDWEKNFNSSMILDKLKSKIEWNNFLKRNQSIMVDLFYGQYKTTISCPKCSHDSTNFSTFLSLQLPIPLIDIYFTLKVNLYEEWLNIKPFICFEITMSKNNNKVIIAKKIIGKIFNISPYQIELFKPNKNEVNKLYNNDEELTPNICLIKAVKMNLKTIEGIDNPFEKNIIEYNDLEKNINEKKDEYISFVKNLNNNNINNSFDDCEIIIDINDDNCENNQKMNFEANHLQKFIVKHYTFNTYKKTISNNIIHKDYLIYTKTKQSCHDLYFQIFFVYYPALKANILGVSQKSDFDELDKHKEEIKNLFNKYYKNYLEEENNFTEDIFDEYPEIPFFLKIKLYKSKVNKFIPNSKKRLFKKFLNQLEKENKTSEIKNKSLEGNKSEEEKEISIEINNSSSPDIISISDNTKENNLLSNKEYEPTLPVQGSSSNIVGDNFTNSKMDLEVNDKNKDKEKKNKSAECNPNSSVVHSILIVFNPKYLIKDAFGDFSLTNFYLEKKDLVSLFKTFNQNIERISINKCFEEFTKIQTLDENNLYKCPKCKQNIAANNKIELYKVPKILIIQLKRFENGQKIKTFIDFPIKNLDISSFISQSSPYFENNSLIKYDLFAVSNHYGELEYGHYDANCLNFMNDQWYNFSDKKVELIEDNNPDIIVTKDAYVLFYRQKKMENIDWDNIYQKKYMEIKDDFNIDNINELKYSNNIKNRIIIKSGIIELDEEEDEKEIEQENSSNDEISLREFVYNPFKDTYLKLKRKLKRNSKKKYIK